MEYKIAVTSFDYIENDDGTKSVIETVRDEVIQNPEGRHCPLCCCCGFSTYPECRKECQNEMWWREKHPEEASAFRKLWFETHPKDSEPFPEDR